MFTKFLILIFVMLISSVAYAAISTSSSTDVPRDTRTPQIHCPASVMSNVKLSSTPTMIDFAANGGAQEQWQPRGGGGWAGGWMGAGFRPNCPDSHPYSCGFSDVWGGGSWSAAGAVVFMMRCCSTPSPPTQLTMKWVSPTSSGTCPSPMP